MALFVIRNLWHSLLLLSVLSSASAVAAEVEWLGFNQLSEPEQIASQALLADAQAHLPPNLLNRLNQLITVRWEAMPDGHAGRSDTQGVLLNEQYLPSLAAGTAQQEATVGPHRTQYQELLATLLHEITHQYDRAGWLSSDEQKMNQRCQQQWQRYGLQSASAQCQGRSARRLSLSDDPRLLDLAGWFQIPGQRGQRLRENHSGTRSPDHYEWQSPQEFVAVNMEYFLLDPSYACRRPTLYRYWQSHFQWQPFPDVDCTAGLSVLNAGQDFAKEPLLALDPERVYAVDYLFAEANEEWASRWGHTMLRLVICAPGRVRGEACRLDLEHHLVLSFRAFVNDIQLSSWDGLTGSYPSRLFILPLNQVINEYTQLELRSLSSIPLRLSREQIQQLVEHSVYLHWGYDGDYYFLTQNCAVETQQLLRNSLQIPELDGMDSILPSGLLRLLEQRGWLDTSVLDDRQQALSQGYFFESYQARYDAMYHVLKKAMAHPEPNLKAWLARPVTERQAFYQTLDMRTLAAAVLVEQAALRWELVAAQEELKQRYFAGGKEQVLQETDETLKVILANTGFLSRPAELLDNQGYGIPQADEIALLQQRSAELQQQLHEKDQQLEQLMRELLSPERQQRLSDIESTLSQVSQRLKSLHQAQGDLQLKQL